MKAEKQIKASQQMKRPRFSLLALLLTFAALAVFFGFSQWRRQEMQREAALIETLGGLVRLPSDYRDYFWQRTPNDASIFVEEIGDGIFRLGNKTYGVEDVIRRCIQLEHQLKDMGVNDIYVTHVVNGRVFEGAKSIKFLRGTPRFLNALREKGL